MIRLEIPRIPETPNNLLGHHWRHRARNSDLWQREIWVALHQHGYGHDHKPYPRARVTIDRRSRGELDPDNLVGSVKPVLDALRYAKILVNDTPRHLELVVTQQRCRGNEPRTLIEIEPLETA